MKPSETKVLGTVILIEILWETMIQNNSAKLMLFNDGFCLFLADEFGGNSACFFFSLMLFNEAVFKKIFRFKYVSH